MKILIINEFLICGGAEQSSLKMKKTLELHNHNVYYLNFDEDFDNKLEKLKNKKNIFNIKIKNNFLNKLIFKPITYLKIRKFIKNINPDKIIVNNLFSSPITQIKALKGYDSYQVIRDYSVVCPKSNSIFNDFKICKGYKCSDCTKKCTYHNSKIQLFFKLYLIKKLEKLRKKYLCKLIAPSQNLTNYLINYGYDAYCVNNPMDILVTKYKKKNLNEHKKYIYVGMINENKGVYEFLEAYKDFSKKKDIELTIIGKCTSREDEVRFKKYLDNKKINYLGYKDHEIVIDELQKNDFIIVPSLWIENYPTTAVEGLVHGVVVLGSNRGGIPEIVGQERGLLFDIMNKNDIIKVLEKSYDLKNDEYLKIQKNGYDYVINNNTYDIYYERLMKIMFIIDTLTKGGAERVISNLSNYLSDKNNEITIVTLLNSNIEYSINKKVNIISLDTNVTNIYNLKKNSKINKFIKAIKRIIKLNKLKKEIKPDILISFMPRPSFLTLFSNYFYKIKTIISVRNDPKIEFASKKNMFLMKWLYPKTDGIVFQTEEAKKYFSKKIQDKGVIIPNPLNPDFIVKEFNGERKESIVSVGRLEKQKNYVLLIEAFNIVSKQFSKYNLIIYGEGSMRKILQDKINELGLQKKIILAGKVDNIKDKIIDSSIFVLPSLYEGMPNSLMEAMALGLPVIATDCSCGGPKFLINNRQNGILIKNNDREELIKAITDLLNDNNLSEKISKEARKITKVLNPNKVFKMWLDYITTIKEGMKQK